MEREINEREIQLRRENIIIGGIPVDQYYTKEETDLLLAEKANVSSVNAINNEISSINQEQTTQNADISQNKLKINTIEGNISTINDNIGTLSGQISSIDSEIDNLSLITETGSQIALNISTSDYKMKALLKDKNGNTIFTSNEIDLPLESVVVDGRYDNTTKKIILTLENGNEIDFSVADLVSGLVSTTELAQELSSYATQQDLQNLPIPVLKYQSSANFELSDKEPGLYVIADSNYAITLKFNNSTKASQLKLLENTIKILKKYDDAENGEVFASCVNLGMVLVNGSWYYDGFTFIKIKKYNNDVLIEQDTKWNFAFARLDQNETISGKYTFTTLPESSVVPTTNDQLVNKAYVDSQAGGGNESFFVVEGNSSSNPFVLEGKKAGIYVFNNSSTMLNQAIVYLKFSNTNTQTTNIMCIGGYIILLKDIENVQAGERLGYFVQSTTGYTKYITYINSNSGISLGTVDYLIEENYVLKKSNDTLTKKLTFTGYLPESSLTPTSNNQLVNKKYVDDAVAGAGGGLTPITQNTTIWDLDEGIYDVAPGIQLKYNTRNFKITVGDHGLILFVEKVANNRKPFYAMGRGIISGYATTNHIIFGSAQNDSYGTYELYEANKLALAVTTNADATMYNKLTFNSYLPESSLTPTTNDQLVNKSYVDSAIASAITTTLGGSY